MTWSWQIVRIYISRSKLTRQHLGGDATGDQRLPHLWLSIFRHTMTLENNIKLPLIGDRMFPIATGGPSAPVLTVAPVGLAELENRPSLSDNNRAAIFTAIFDNTVVNVLSSQNKKMCDCGTIVEYERLRYHINVRHWKTRVLVISPKIVLFHGFCGNHSQLCSCLEQVQGQRGDKWQVGDRWDARSLYRPFWVWQRGKKTPTGPRPLGDPTLSIRKSLHFV